MKGIKCDVHGNSFATGPIGVCVLAPDGTLRSRRCFSAAPPRRRQTRSRALPVYVGMFSSPLRDTLPSRSTCRPAMAAASTCSESISLEVLRRSPNCPTLNAAGTRLSSTRPTASATTSRHRQLVRHRRPGRQAGRSWTRSSAAAPARPTPASVRPASAGRQLLRRQQRRAAGARRRPTQDRDQRQGRCRQARIDAGDGLRRGGFAISDYDETHACMIAADLVGRSLLLVVLGLVKTFARHFGTQKGRLTPNDPPALDCPSVGGPPHFHFHPNGRFLYSLQELAAVDGYPDRPRRRRGPAGIHVRRSRRFAARLRREHFCSGILVSAADRFVDAGNRLHDSIAIFLISRRRRSLTYFGEEATRGSYAY